MRLTTPGVGLISPPPHHDIYSIEDLKQLIYDLRCANPEARISVKLVAEVGVGTVAAGVAKAGADHVLISGHDGGTGAAPLSSILHAGIPWEIGLAETQQTLMRNDLRSRIWVQTDGQLKTGRDVVIAALLGADEMGFATAPLIATGCVMMRACHLNTCPVGIATQDPELRKKFAGKPEHVVNFFFFVAEEARRIMAQLGIARFDDLVGRVDLLDVDDGARAVARRAASTSRRSSHGPEADGPRRRTEGAAAGARRRARLAADRGGTRRDRRRRADRGRVRDREPQPHGRRAALERGHARARRGGPARRDDPLHAARLGRAVVRRVARAGHRADARRRRERLRRQGPLRRRARAAPARRRGASAPRRTSIAGNTILYGATAGRAFFRGLVGERFAVRNSGATAVVEGVGDHGCEYMTGGVVVVLGRTGRNFAAGMSGGIAYVLDEDGTFAERCNHELVGLEPLEADDVAHRARPRRRSTSGARARRSRRASSTTGRRAAPLREGDAARLPRSARAAPRPAGLGRRPRPLHPRVRDGRGGVDGRDRRLQEVRPRRSRPSARPASASATTASSCARSRSSSCSEQGARCMECGVPFCHHGCPLGNLIPDWNDLVYRDRFREAIDQLHRTNNFPEFTGRLCPAPCEAACVLEIEEGNAVTIKQIELAIVDRAWDEGWIVAEPPRDAHRPHASPSSARGPSGLACAQQLNRAGHTVTVFERDEAGGGLLRFGVPDFKIEKHVVERRLAQLAEEGVEFRFGVDVADADRALERLRRGRARAPARAFRATCRCRAASSTACTSRWSTSTAATATSPGTAAPTISARGQARDRDRRRRHRRRLRRERAPRGRGVGDADRAARRAAGAALATTLTPWPLWPVKLRTSYALKEGGERSFAISTTRLLRRRSASSGSTGCRTAARRRSTPVAGTEESQPAELVLLAMGFVGPEPALLEALGVERDARGNVARTGVRDERARRLRRGRRAPRPVADRVGDRGGSPLRDSGRRLVVRERRSSPSRPALRR